MNTDNSKKIIKLIGKLLEEVGEDPTREGLLKNTSTGGQVLGIFFPWL